MSEHARTLFPEVPLSDHGDIAFSSSPRSSSSALAKAHGCDDPILYTQEDFAERVREITAGAGVSVVYDSIGKDTFLDSLSCLRPLGMLVLFGAASGPVPPFDHGLLAKMGSLFVTRPTLMTYAARQEDLRSMAEELFEVVLSRARSRLR